MNEVVQFIEDNKVMVICRGLYNEDLMKVVDALYAGGVRLAEVTFDQNDPDAVEKTSGAIRQLKEKYPEQVRQERENTYTVPKACVLIREPYSEQRRAAARERAKTAGIRPPDRGASSKK